LQEAFMARHILRARHLGLLAALLAASPALAQVAPAAQASPGAEAILRFDFPAEGRDIGASARAAMAPCGRGAVSQTWHMACMFEVVWGSNHDHLNHPPPHSAAFLAAAMAEASAQTTRYRTRESEVYRHLAQHFTRSSRQVSYTTFLDAAGKAFRRVPPPGTTVTAEASTGR
jgi:hypothetical protein